MWIDQRGSEVLTRNECVRLLALRAGGVGRMAFEDSGQIVVQPVNYRMLDTDLLVQVGPGSMLEAARHKTTVSFEVDHVSASEAQAWSVLVHGLASVFDARVEGARPTDAGPWVAEPGTSFVRVRTEVLSGRRFTLRTAAPATGNVTSTTDSGPAVSRRSLGDLALRPPTRVSREATVRQVAGVMEDEDVSAVLVGEHPAWLVTERDLMGAVAAGLAPDAPAANLATKTPLWATTSTTLSEAAAMMADHGVRHLVVITASGEPVGAFSMVDAVRHLLERRSDEIDLTADRCASVRDRQRHSSDVRPYGSATPQAFDQS